MCKRKPQHDRLFDLLKQYSDRYYVEIEMIYARFARTWNPYPCRFEIDTYFLSRLSMSLQNPEHPQTEWQQTCMDFENQITQFYSGRFTTEGNLQDILRKRITKYHEIDNWVLEDNESIDTIQIESLLHDIKGGNDSLDSFLRDTRKTSAPKETKCREIALLEMLLRNIDASIIHEDVVPDPPIVIGDFFERMELKSNILPIQMCVSGEFHCCLKCLFRSTSDVYLLTLEEMDSLIDKGIEDAKQRLSQVDLSKLAYLNSATYLIRKILEDGLFSKDELLGFTGSKIVRRIIMQQKDFF